MKEFTRIQNDLLLALMAPGLTLHKLRVLLFIIRFSNGFNKKEASAIQTDFTSIKFTDQRISKLLPEMVEEKIIIHDKVGKKMRINIEKLIENISFNEEKYIKVIRKNLPNKKAKAYTFDDKKLAKDTSQYGAILPSVSHNAPPKDNKERLKTTNTDVDLILLKFLRSEESVKNPEGYLRWLKSNYGEGHLKRLLNVEFSKWIEHLEYWKKE